MFRTLVETKKPIANRGELGSLLSRLLENMNVTDELTVHLLSRLRKIRSIQVVGGSRSHSTQATLTPFNFGHMRRPLRMRGGSHCIGTEGVPAEDIEGCSLNNL